MLDRFEAIDGDVALETGESHSFHFTLAVENQPPSGLVHFLGHPDLFLVNDVTRFAPAAFLGKFPDHRLITVRSSHTAAESEPAEYFVAKLRDIGYLSGAAAIRAHETMHLYQTFLTQRCLKALQSRLGGKLTLLSTGDLGFMSSALKYKAG
jgi:hypothetical protein